MARALRRESMTGIHHVMNRGVDRQPIFFSDADRLDFGRQLAWAHEHMGVATLAYCLMGNHFHLLLHAPPGTLSTAMQHVMGVYTRHANDRHGRDGPLFRGRFHSIPVETEAYLLWAARYIHRNALDLPGVRSPRDHRWSSYRAYLRLRPVPAFLDLAPVSTALGGPDAVRAFTEDDSWDGGAERSTLRDVHLLVEAASAIDDLTHASGDAARARLARTLLILLADRTSDPELRRILHADLAHPSPAAMTLAVRRARRRHDAEPMVRRVLAWIEGELTDTRGLTPCVAAL